MKNDIGIIGLGRLGMSLCRALSENGRRPAAVSSRTYDDRYAGYGFTADKNEVVRKSDVIFLCVNDDSLSKLSADIAACFDGLEGKIFIHCSGLLPGAVLDDLKNKGAQAASLHPLQTFPDKRSEKNFYNITYAFEGDDVLKDIEGIFDVFDPSMIKVRAEDKPAYHAAAVISSNLLCSLLDVSDSMLRAIGIDEGIRIHGDLIYTTIGNIMAGGTAYALTGPAARGDRQTVRKHLEALGDDIADIYRALSLRAARIGLASGSTGKEGFDLLEKELERRDVRPG